MTQWYCHVGGQQYGPVSDDVLAQWAQQGRLGSGDLVWSQGMPQWLPAAAALPHLFPAGAPPVSRTGAPPPLSLTEIAPSAGTWGATPNAQLMAQARGLLSGHWGTAILVVLIEFGMGALPVGGLAQLILGGAFELGAVIFFLMLARRGEGKVGMMFWGFRNFGNSVGAYLLQALFVLLWSLLLIIPGIIASLAYSQTFYLMADNKSLGPLEAIRKSKQMMDGHKWKLFCLGMRFIGWALLCILTLGIGYLFLVPYMATAHARFYDDLAPGHVPAAGNQPVVLTPSV